LIWDYYGATVVLFHIISVVYLWLGPMVTAMAYSAEEEIESTLDAEYDARVFRALGAAVSALNGVVEGPDWAVAGSQEISTWRLTFSSAHVVATAETYMGVTLRGPPDIVSRLTSAVKAELVTDGA